MSNFRFSLLKNFIDSEVPPGSDIVLIGPPGVGKTIFCENFLVESCMNRGKNLYVTLDYTPKEVRKRMSLRGINLDNEDKKLVFVDGYSWLLGESSEAYHVNNLSNLSDLSVKMISASNEAGEGTFFIFDSISTLLVYSSENEVERFLGANMARMKHNNNVGIWVIEQGIHSESFYNALRHMVDGVLEMRFDEREELGRSIRMHTFKDLKHQTRWIPFTIRLDGSITMGE